MLASSDMRPNRRCWRARAISSARCSVTSYIAPHRRIAPLGLITRSPMPITLRVVPSGRRNSSSSEYGSPCSTARATATRRRAKLSSLIIAG